MWISSLLIDTGDNPDRPRPGRLWLRNLYHVHQRLCMAFPSSFRKADDEHFLAPYNPADFPEQRHLADKKKAEVDSDLLKQVHSKRNADSGFLFRIDPQPGGRAVILVQSALQPDWDYAFRNAGYLLAAPPEAKPFDPCFAPGERLRFRLLANPTRRLSENSLGPDGQPIKRWSNHQGKGLRLPVPADQLLDWLTRYAGRTGFSLDTDSATITPGYVYFRKDRDGDGIRLRSVRYEGVLKVTDPGSLREAVMRGIGPGKAFGFGLLSVASL